jgi:vacuolar-type H+-ATPase subunit H
MKRSAAPGRPVIEDTFVPELEAEEAGFESLLQHAKDEAAGRILEAEQEAEKSLSQARNSLAAETAEVRRAWSTTARDARREEREGSSSHTERLVRDAKAGLEEAIDRLIAIVSDMRDKP